MFARPHSDLAFEYIENQINVSSFFAAPPLSLVNHESVNLVLHDDDVDKVNFEIRKNL